MSLRHLLLTMPVVVLGVALVGCGSTAITAQTESATELMTAGEQGSGQAHDAEHGTRQDHQCCSTSSRQAYAGCCGNKSAPKGFAGLSEEDRALAEKQKVCPVSGAALGSVGKPFKVIVKGRAIFLCCPGCEDELRGNADLYLKPHPDRKT